MDSWSSQTASPDIKFENSPAESFLSAPGDMYPSLFGTPASTTMNPLEIMTPQSFPEDKTSDVAGLTMSAASTPAPEDAPTGDKKQSKKRKSWGQVLPEPKTNLPPRKRAKTDDEKEQRRVERVLRNRRAAQSSRERKRLEVEALEKRNKELETALLHAQKTNLMLAEQLNKFRRDSGVASSAFDSFRPNPITFSQELFGSQDGHGSVADQNKPSLMDELLMSAQSNNTVNPASLSPALSPVPEEETGEDLEDDEPATTATPAAEAAAIENISPDVTQHPAEVLCSGLQCQSAEMPQSWLASQQPLHPALALYLQLQLLLTSTSTILSVCRRPLTQIAMSLKAGFSLPPTRPILNTIIWLVTQPSPSRLRRQRTTTSTSSTSMNSSTTTKRQPHQSHLAAASQPTTSPLRSTNLRLKSLRKILTCSPVLARPLMDATMEVLRLVSSEGREFDRIVDGEKAGSSAAAAPDLQGRWLNGAKLPSKEVLLTLLWALKVEEKRLQIRERLVTPIPSGPGKTDSVLQTTTPDNQKYVLKVVAKRGFEEQHQGQGIPCGKRRRSRL